MTDLILAQALARSGLRQPVEGRLVAEERHDGAAGVTLRLRFAWLPEDVPLRVIPDDEEVTVTAVGGPFKPSQLPLVPYLASEFPAGPTLTVDEGPSGFTVTLTTTIRLVELAPERQIERLQRELRAANQRTRLCLRLLALGNPDAVLSPAD